MLKKKLYKRELNKKIIENCTKYSTVQNKTLLKNV